MKLRYRHIFETSWKECEGEEFLNRLVSPVDTYIVKLICDHKNTWVDFGIKRCKDCGDELEITSYRY